MVVYCLVDPSFGPSDRFPPEGEELEEWILRLAALAQDDGAVGEALVPALSVKEKWREDGVFLPCKWQRRLGLVEWYTSGFQ